MDELTVQMAGASTDVPADCVEADDVRPVPTQEPFSETATDSSAALTDAATDPSKTEGTHPTPSAQYLPVYKGKVIPVDASDTKEITTLLQLGMKQREWQPLMDDLQRLAAQCGAKSIRELVESSCKAYEQKALNEAVALYGEQEGRARFERYKAQFEQNAQPPVDEQAALHERLAEEFTALTKEFPEYTAVEQLPDEVLRTAMTQNVSLTDALLRFEHRESRRIRAEQAAARAAAETASEPLWQAAGDPSSTAMDAFLQGLHRRL